MTSRTAAYRARVAAGLVSAGAFAAVTALAVLSTLEPEAWRDTIFTGRIRFPRPEPALLDGERGGPRRLPSAATEASPPPAGLAAAGLALIQGSASVLEHSTPAPDTPSPSIKAPAPRAVPIANPAKPIHSVPEAEPSQATPDPNAQHTSAPPAPTRDSLQAGSSDEQLRGSSQGTQQAAELSVAASQHAQHAGAAKELRAAEEELALISKELFSSGNAEACEDSTLDQEAVAGNLAALQGGIGREADALRRDLAKPVLSLIAALAAWRQAQLALVVPLMRCSRHRDILGARGRIFYDTGQAGVAQRLDRLAQAFSDPADGLLGRLERAERNLAEGGSCLRALTRSNLAGGRVAAIACHRKAGAGLTAVEQLSRELPALGRIVMEEFKRIVAVLKPVANDPKHPDQPKAAAELAWLGPHIGWVSKHLREADSVLSKPLVHPVDPGLALSLGRRLRLRVSQIEGALEPLYAASRMPGVLRAADPIQAALLHLSPWARFAGRGLPLPQRAPAGPASPHITELSEGSLSAFYDLTDSWRAFQTIEPTTTARARAR